MHNFLSDYYLQVMGIQAWHAQTALPGAYQGINFQPFLLYSQAEEIKGILCLESLPANESVWRLLDAMLAAVQLKYLPISENYILTKSNKLVLIMGSKLAQHALNSTESFDVLRAANMQIQPNGALLLMTYHPQELLTEPANKAKAWQDLKKLLAV